MVYIPISFCWGPARQEAFWTVFSKWFPVSSILPAHIGKFPTSLCCCPRESIWAPAAIRQPTLARTFHIYSSNEWVKHQFLLASNSLMGPCHLIWGEEEALFSPVACWGVGEKLSKKKFPLFLALSALTPLSVEDGWLRMLPRIDSYSISMFYICGLVTL